MKSNSINKLSFYLQMLKARFGDGEYFIEMNISFKSGTKQFPASVKKDGEKLVLSFSGTKKDFEWKEIENIAREYDAMVLVYKERGTDAIITADDRNVTLKYDDIAPIEKNTTATVGERQYLIAPPKANDLLKEIGIMGQNGKIKNDMVRKYNQIDHFVELISDYLKKLDGKIEVLDCACGKSYLSFALNYYLKDVLKKDCHVTGVDYSEIVIEASKKSAKNLGYNNMTFVKADLTTYTPERKPDVVISLHACDTATDMAIGAAINAGAKAIFAVPCCHKELLGQYSYEPFTPLLKYGIFKARQADLLTDSLRCLLLEASGYSVTAQEYISPVETPKNLLIKAFKDGKNAKKATHEYYELKKMLGINPKLETLIKLEAE
ncbi:MAG: SAM-dependent methyltransferase [Clostridia bacterium]|nr:SAM-dependent methyltransferase [Clostridia bacterium]